MDDVAKLVAACIESPDAENAVIEFGGPEPVTQHQVVAVFEEVSGRPFEVQHVPEEGLVAQWEGAEDPLGRSMAAIMLDYARGDVIEMDGVRANFPAPVTSIRDYAAKVLAQP
jgi:uncharacterized protein YbjT (DUF2867 family)